MFGQRWRMVREQRFIEIEEFSSDADDAASWKTLDLSYTNYSWNFSAWACASAEGGIHLFFV